MKKLQKNVLTMAGPATYMIVVQGNLNPSMACCMGGMNITERVLEDGKTETILVGRLADQAALSGVLNTLYELHLPMSSVELLDDK